MLFVMQSLDNLLPSLASGTTTAVYNVDSCLAEMEDLLSYCNDILCTGSSQCIYFLLVFLSGQLQQACEQCDI